MFLVRSAFWLTVAFLTIHPQTLDVGAAATALSNQAVDAGKRVVVAEVLGIGLERIRVIAGDSALTPKDNGAFSSRISFMCGNAAIQAAQEL